MVDDAVDTLDFNDPDSGFSWYKGCPSWSIRSSKFATFSTTRRSSRIVYG